jgi:hypothetical protein
LSKLSSRSCTRFLRSFYFFHYLNNLQEFIEGIDAIDNGISQYPAELKPAYKVRTDLSSRVSWLNPPWNMKADLEDVDVYTSLTSCVRWALISFSAVGKVPAGFDSDWSRVPWEAGLLLKLMAPGA